MLFFGLYVTKSMMSGNNKYFLIIVAFFILSALLLRMDKYYWVLAAFLFGISNGRNLPIIRFSGGEFGSIVLICMYFVRQSLHRENVQQSNMCFVGAALPFIIWMCFVWTLHPAGMQVLGGESMGGRFYILVFLSFAAMFCFSKMSLGERDSKLLVFAICFGYLSFVLDVLVKGGARSLFSGGARTHYEVLRLSFIAPAFLCRYSISELIVHPRALIPFTMCFVLSVWSGNRTAAARTAIVGFLSPFFLKRNRKINVILLFIAVYIVGFLAIGQGRLWNLPYSVQRSFSFLPAKWTDPRVLNAGFNDDFRAEMRKFARAEISRNPLTGRGGFAIDSEALRWLYFTRINRGVGSGHSLTGNWHNVWLGFAADFGIPLSIAWAVFIGVFLVYGYRMFHDFTPGSWAQSAYLYLYLLGVVEFINSFFNGGHSAMTPALYFPWAGMMIAIHNGNERSHSAKTRMPITKQVSNL